MGWLKVDHNLAEKPEVLHMAALLNLDPDLIAGKCLRCWSWFDLHTRDWYAPTLTALQMDRHLNCPGFVEAMADKGCGWLQFDNGPDFPGIRMVNPERHMSGTAKKNAQAQSRMQAYRARQHPEEKPGEPQIGGMNRPAAARRPDGVIDHTPDRHAAEFKAAVTALTHWSSKSPPVGRGYGLRLEQNEGRRIASLLDELAEAAPIPRGGDLVHRHRLVAAAIEVLIRKPVEFKDVGWACGCIKRELADWANGSTPRNGSSRTPQQAESENKAAEVRRRIENRKAGAT